MVKNPKAFGAATIKPPPSEDPFGEVTLTSNTGMDTSSGIYTTNLTDLTTAEVIQSATAVIQEQLSPMDKLEQVKAAVLHQNGVLVYCKECKYRIKVNYSSHCSLTARKVRDALHEFVEYHSCASENASNDCDKFKRTRMSKIKRSINMALRLAK